MATERGLDISEVINITTTVQDGGTIVQEFGTGLLITEDDSIPAGGARKCQRFTGSDGVADVFDSARVENDAAVWFGGDPAPKALYIGRWAREAVNTTLVTGVITETAANIQDITNGSYRLNGQDDTAISFSSAQETYASVGDVLANAITTITGTGTATAVYDATTKRYTINFGSPNDLGAFSIASSSVGTDLTDTFKLKESDGAVYNLGSNAETLTDAVSRCAALATGGAPTALMLAGDVATTYDNPDGDTVSTKTEMRTIAQAGDYMYAMLDTSAGALVSGESTSDLAVTASAGQNKVIGVYSRGTTIGSENYAPRPDIGIMAKLSGQNLDLPASIITLANKTLPSVGATTLDATQKSELDRKRATYYTNVGGLANVFGGSTASAGTWADAQWWLLWLKSETERTVFQAMRSSNRFSRAELIDALSSVMSKAVRNGGAKPGGKVNAATKHQIQQTTGNFDFDGILNTGYIIWVDPTQTQTDADRAARISRFKVWIAPSDAIHTVSGAIVLSG